VLGLGVSWIEYNCFNALLHLACLSLHAVIFDGTTNQEIIGEATALIIKIQIKLDMWQGGGIS
jgi:hypothetical protein